MFYIIVLAGILGLIGTDLFVPSLPAIAQIFHQTPNHTQLLISLFLAGFSISQLFYGPISDRIGRKPPLVFGVTIFTLGSLICTFAPNFVWLCAGRIIQGIGVGSGLSLARVIMRDLYHGTTLAIKSSQIGTFISATPAIAPFVGGILQQHFGFRASFIFMFCYGLILIALLLTRFKEPIQQKTQQLTFRGTLTNYASLLKNINFMRYVIISGFAFGSIILYANITPFIIQDQLKLSATQNGLIILIAAFGVSSGAIISSRIVHVINSEKLVNSGLFIFVCCGLLLVLTQYLFGTNLYCLVPLLFIVTIACGFIFPNALTLCFAQIHVNIGVAGAIYGCIQIFISMLINLLLNFIPNQNQSLLGLFYIGIGIVGFILIFFKKSSHPIIASEKSIVITLE